MRPGVDVWVPYYRDLGVVLRAGMTPYEVFLGVFSKAEDPTSGGRQMPAHWGSARLQIVSHSSPIATQVPHAAGIAYAARYRGEDVVVGCWFGEGATSAGDWHEGVNFAAIHRLPVVFVCENNEYAISVPQSKQMVVADVADRAPGYGIPGVVVDGSDVLACYEAMREAHDRARAGEGPTLIECKTYRYLPAHLRRRRQVLPLARGGGGAPAPRPHRPLRVGGCSNAGYLDDAGARGDLADELLAEVEAAIAAGVGGAGPRPGDRDAARVRGGPVTEKNLVAAIRDAAARRDGRRRPGRCCSARTWAGAGASSKISEGFLDEFGEARVVDTPLAESAIVGRRDRDGAPRTAARGRDRVRGLHPPRVRSDRVGGRPDALPDERGDRGARW